MPACTANFAVGEVGHFEILWLEDGWAQGN